MEADTKAAVDMLHRLATVEPEQRMDTLALVIKTYIEAGNRYSQLAHVWAKIEAKA